MPTTTITTTIKIPTRVLLLACGLIAMAAAPAAAQEWPWWARAGYERDLIDSELSRWTDWERWSVAVGRRFDGGSAAVELIRSRRFSRDDDAVAGDLYLDLADRTYVNVRVQLAPDAEVVAERDVRLELFHGFADGWEGSLGGRWISIGGEEIQVYGGSLARYLPGWYLRARADLNPSFDQTSVLVSAAARRYLAGVEGFVELGAGAGEEVVEIAPGADGADVDVRGSRFVALRSELFPWERVGVEAGASYHGLDDLPTRFGLGVGVIVRF